jgi:hypothetical protein
MAVIQITFTKEEKARLNLKDDHIIVDHKLDEFDSDPEAGEDFFFLKWDRDQIMTYMVHSMPTKRLKKWVEKYL